MSFNRHLNDAIQSHCLLRFRVLSPTLEGEDAMRSHDKGSGASAQLNSLRRLTVKPHANALPSRTHKECRIRLYDGDRVVGYVSVPNALLMITISAALWALIYLATRW
jgi:hypothetical protein